MIWDGLSPPYATIVADPPWAIDWHAGRGEGRSGRDDLPYSTMSLEDICALSAGHLVTRSVATVAVAWVVLVRGVVVGVRILVWRACAGEPAVPLGGVRRAKGADTHAADWATENHVPLHRFYARWNEHGKAAGPIRNQQMLDEGTPDLVIAFHDNLAESKGTADMVRRAKKAGVPVYLVSRP